MDNEKFSPLTSSHGNVNGEIAHLRDTYLDAETDYYIELLKVPEIFNQFVVMIDYPPEALYEDAIKRINAIENGEVEKFLGQSENVSEEQHMNNIELLEGTAIMLLGAIRDKAMVKELILRKQQEEQSHGMRM